MTEDVEVCRTPLVKDCETEGEEECRTVYESECWTKYHTHKVGSAGCRYDTVCYR